MNDKAEINPLENLDLSPIPEVAKDWVAKGKQMVAVCKALNLKYRVRTYTSVFFSGGIFAPLLADEDALWMAVKLQLKISIGSDQIHVIWCRDNKVHKITEPAGDDPCKATRLAIVKAGEQIGKNMKTRVVKLKSPRKNDDWTWYGHKTSTPNS